MSSLPSGEVRGGVLGRAKVRALRGGKAHLHCGHRSSPAELDAERRRLRRGREGMDQYRMCHGQEQECAVAQRVVPSE